MDPDSITVLVTFVGGPADGPREHRSLAEATGKVTMAMRRYFSRPATGPLMAMTS
jgi:hypothetical protein